MSRDIKLPDPAATERLGAALASGIGPGRVLHLRGELGAGKTTLARGLLHALGCAGRIKSPTYTVVEPYAVSSLNLYHFDFYRFSGETEWVNSGFRDYFAADAACIVEWPERAGPLLPPPDLEVKLELAGEARRALVTACTPAGESWLSSLPSSLRG
jgi:tRNA threonylcarbamoyladenosine biosynthesis protein TsaE